ncbi:MAG: alpha/beta hydrolase [Pseudomonadota bacterium]
MAAIIFIALITAKEDRLASFKEVTYALWSNEAHEAYLKVLLRARKHGVPVFFVGYSLGGLLGVDLLADKPAVHFDKMVLFAPALAVQPVSYHLKPLKAFPGIVIDSESPETYRANEGTPVAAYNALFEALDHFEKTISKKLNIPTLVFIDEGDEFVSYQHLKELIDNNKLDQWLVFDVQKDSGSAENSAHHMIIDEQCMGKAMWKRMREMTLRHLLN